VCRPAYKAGNEACSPSFWAIFCFALVGRFTFDLIFFSYSAALNLSLEFLVQLHSLGLDVDELLPILRLVARTGYNLLVELVSMVVRDEESFGMEARN
jgi:hypothetical protein